MMANFSEVCYVFTSIEKCSETFQQIQIELRNDYLIRGICEREVDQVVREVKNMKHIFFLKRYSGIFEEHPHLIGKICEDFLHLSHYILRNQSGRRL